MVKLRWMWLVIGLLCGIPVMSHAQTVATLTTEVQSDQRAAMHSSARDDIARHPNASRYQIISTIDPVARTWQGQQTLTYTNQSGVTLDKLYFRLFPNLPDLGGDLTITAASVAGVIVPVQYEANRYLARLDLATPLASGSQITTILDFVTTVPDNVGQSLYGAFNHDSQNLALASAYPMLANNPAGIWEIEIPDTKGDLVNSPVAVYDVTITAPLGYSIVTTGTATSSTRTATDQQIHVVSGLQRDFMVVATTLARVSTTVDGTTINVYYPNGNLRGGHLALKFARQAVHLYNGMFGQYPYNELDMVAVDAGTFYGVEYPGLLLFEQRLFNKAWFFESIVAHEVAHQWFYNVIGNDVQTHAWVDESFATYAQVLYREKIWGASAATIERTGFVNQYAKLQARNSDGPIEQHMREFTLYSYNVLAYAKAALYLDAVRAQVGPEVFAQAMRDYYAAHRYKVVDGTAFVGAVQSACNCDIQPLYNQWVLGQ